MADDLPQIDNPISVFPKPQRMFPEDARPAGGQYLNARTKEDMTGHKAAMASIGVNPGGRPYFNASPDSVEQTGSPGRGSAIAKTNLFKQRAGWSWLQAPENHEDTNTIVSVEHRGDHHYALNAHFPKGVELARYAESKSEPRLRPTTRGNLTKGTQVGSISVRGKEHPVYDHVIVKADGGIVGNPDDNEGITAYHGSPHDFPQFDLSKIGTGEGAQAFGHGLYFAENEPVAIGYRNKLSEGTYKTDTGEIFDPYKNLEHMNVRVAAYKGIDPAIERAQGLLQSDPYDDRVHRDLEKLYALKVKNAAPHKGHMYEVQINAHPDHFLDWDKPISEQSEHVQKAIRHIAGQLDIDPFEHLALAAVVGRHPRSQTYSPRGEDLHTDIDEILSGKEHASKALHAAGIKGIRYLDAGSRPDGAYALHISHKGIPYTDPIPMKTFQQAQNHAKEYAAKGYDTEIKENGSRNYVVFDDKLVNVKRKYAKGGTVQRTPKPVSDGSIVSRALMLTSKKA